MSSTLSIGEYMGSLDLMQELGSIIKAVVKSMVRAGIGLTRSSAVHFHDVCSHFCTTEHERFVFAGGSICIGSATRMVGPIEGAIAC